MRGILSDIFSDSLSDKLAFKGGTLAYLLYGLDRFSTDIDIDLLDLSYESQIIALINKLLPRRGEIKSFLVGKHLHRWLFRYDERSMNIKIELNKRVSPYNSYEVKYIDGVPVQTMTFDAMVTNKLIALSARYYNRDLYDTHFFLKQGCLFDGKIIQERTGYTTEEVITEIITTAPSHYAINSILGEGMGDVLTDKQKIRVKHHLLDETIQALKAYLVKVS